MKTTPVVSTGPGWKLGTGPLQPALAPGKKHIARPQAQHTAMALSGARFDPIYVSLSRQVPAATGAAPFSKEVRRA